MSIPSSGEPAIASSKGSPVLEKNVALSRSLLWERQRGYYIQRGLETWTKDNIPQFITNNPFIAEIYANIVCQFVCDCVEQNRTQPDLSSPSGSVRILELGGGTGKFACLFLHHLEPLLRARGLPRESVHYVLTDCSESILESWRNNPYLAEFVNRGILEFALVDAVAVKAESTPGPLVVIANYVFDSLPQDAFVIREGKLLEQLVTVVASRRQGGPAEPALRDLQLSFESAPLSADRYSEAAWNATLEQYRTRLPDANVLFPSAGLKLLEELRSFGDGRMLVLTADKGFPYEDALALAPNPPAFEWHAANCFSLMVNFDAIAKYFLATGGDALLPDKHASTLHICGFLRGRPGEAFPGTHAAYRQSQEAFGPDDLFSLLAWLNAHMEEISIPQILATLRLSLWDPVALIRLFPVLGRQIRNVVAEREDLRNAVQRVWANHYPVTPGENILAFDCGVILLELRFFEEAMHMFTRSQQLIGPSAATSYNLGLCASGLGRSTEALSFMAEACSLDPKFEPAQSARTKLQSHTQPSG